MAICRPSAPSRVAIAGGFEPDDDPNSAEPVGDRPVHVMADCAFGHFEALRATERHILANRGDGVGDRLAHRAAARVMRAEHLRRVDVGRVVERDREHAAHHRLEVIVASDEVGFGINLDKNADIVLDGDADQTFGRDPAALLGGLGEALLAQPIDCRLDVAVGLAQRILAIHHARAGLFAQILDQSGGNGRHASLFRPQSRARLKPYSAAINSRACSLHLSRAMRPLNRRSASSFSASAGVIAASCQ